MAIAIPTPAELEKLKNLPQGPVTEPDFLNVTKGLKSWLVTLDHKRIGMMYLFGILISLIVGGTFALLVRTELFEPWARRSSGRTPTTSSSRCTAP